MKYQFATISRTWDSTLDKNLKHDNLAKVRSQWTMKYRPWGHGSCIFLLVSLRYILIWNINLLPLIGHEILPWDKNLNLVSRNIWQNFQKLIRKSTHYPLSADQVSSPLFKYFFIYLADKFIKNAQICRDITPKKLNGICSKVNQVIYSSSPISCPSFKHVAQYQSRYLIHKISFWFFSNGA